MSLCLCARRLREHVWETHFSADRGRLWSMCCSHLDLHGWDPLRLCLLHVCIWDMLSTDLQTNGAACVRGGVWDVLRVCHRGTRQRGRGRGLARRQLSQSFWFVNIKVSLSLLAVMSNVKDTSSFCLLFLSMLEYEPSSVYYCSIWKSVYFLCQ